MLVVLRLQTIPSTFWSQKLIELVLECVLSPSSVGFDVTDVDIAEHLPSKVAVVRKSRF